MYTLQDEVLKYNIEIARALKEQVSELEACKKKELEEYNEKMKWQMDRLMKCDKEKESLEAKVTILMNQIEALSNDRDKKVATLETDLKVKDEQIITANMEHLNELAQLQAAPMTLEAENSHLECGSLKSIIVAKSEELKRCSQDISELNAALLREKEGRASVDTELKKAEEEIVTLKQELEHHGVEITRINELEKYELALELELKKQRCECASLREALQSESTNLKEEIMKLKVYQSTNKQQSQTLLRLKEELNIAKVSAL